MANFILAAVIFFFLAIVGETSPEVRLGVISTKSVLYEKGFRAGDVLVEVNGHKIFSPVDFPIEQEKYAKVIRVRRDNKVETIRFSMPIQDFFKEFMSTPPLLRSPLLIDREGKRWGISLSRDKVDFSNTLDHMAMTFKGREFFLFAVTSKSSKKGIFEYSKTDIKTLSFTAVAENSFFVLLMKKNYYPVDLIVQSVSMGSAADKAKLLGGDIIISLNGNQTSSFEDLRYSLKLAKERDVSLSLIRNGIRKELILTPQIKEINGVKRKLIGVYSGGEFLPVNYVDIAGKSFMDSLPVALNRTWGAIVKTFSGFKKLITAEVSFKAVGGPLSIGKVAVDSFETSLSYFFQIMALISVNLGVINLFPIPVLDGGHIVFLIFETINRGPLSRRKLEIAQQFGLSLLLLLMVAALFNDFTRFF